MTIDKICRNYNTSRSGLKTEAKYNLKPDRTLKYFRLGCFNCDGYDESCESYKSQIKYEDKNGNYGDVK